MGGKRTVLLGGLLAVLLGAGPGAAQPDKAGVEGLWLGTLKVGEAELRLLFRIERKGDALTATVDSLDQGVKGIKAKTVEFKEGKLRLEIPEGVVTYTGQLAKDGKTITGTLSQGGKDLPLTLARTDRAPSVARPQTPKKPYPYREEEVTFENKKGKVKFAGTLTLPQGKGPFACAVLLTGSGPQDRDETIFGHKPFLVLADHLTRKGIAVLRTDDRGVGGSTGSVMKSTTADFADDALAAVEFLKGHQEIDPKRIGFIGHSEGGAVGPLAASRSKEIAFVVMLAGPGLPGEEVLYLQGQAILKAVGADAKALANQRKMQEISFRAAREKDDEAALKKFDELWAAFVAQLPAEEQKLAAEQAKGIRADFQATVLTPWWRFFLVHDPRPALRQVRCPVLALFGEKDVQVTPKENLAAVEAALKEAGNKDVTLKVIPGVNHLFQTCKTGALIEYGQIEETLAPAALEVVSEWLLKRVK
jgi:pimeloyl-ACP methyl ester carboxylesterase